MKELHPGSRFDMHLHSTASDGRFDPESVMLKCARAGLDVVALTDHDLAATLEPGPHTLEGRTIHVIPGAEISGVHDGTEYHLLVYFPRGVPEPFRHFCRAQCRERATRYERAMQVLGLNGVIDPTARRGGRALTRLHLAHALVEAGVVSNRREAFATYLGDRHGTVERLSLPFIRAIGIARQHGGFTSWAHPPRTAVEEHLPVFAAAGLQGLEGIRPKLNSEARRFYRKMAHRYGLYITGGSDWHGWRHADPGLFRVQAREIQDFVDALLAA